MKSKLSDHLSNSSAHHSHVVVSSRVYKKNIKPFKEYEKALKDILQVPLFTYQFKAKESHPEKIRMGLIAEELPNSLQLQKKQSLKQQQSRIESKKNKSGGKDKAKAEERAHSHNKARRETDKKGEEKPRSQSYAAHSHDHEHNHGGADPGGGNKEARPPAPDWPSVYGTLWAGIKALAARLDALKASLDLNGLKTAVFKETENMKAGVTADLAASEAKVEAAFKKELAARDEKIKRLEERIKRLENPAAEERRK